MGSNLPCNTANITVDFLNGKQNVHQTGNALTGTVRLVSDGPSPNHVVIQLLGELVYTTYQRKGKSTLTDDHQVPFLLQTVHHKENHGAKNEYPFSFHLDACLPPSLEQLRGEGPYIHYVLRVRSSAEQCQRDFPIIIERPVSQLEGHREDARNKPSDDVHLQVNLKNNLAFIGQPLTGRMQLDNPHGRTIDRVSCKLIQIRKIGPLKEERSVIRKTILTQFDKFKGDRYDNNFQVDIPHGIQSTCSYHLPNQWFIFIHYELQVKVYRRGLARNSSLTVPILINSPIEARR